ncbi:MAG: ABC transporter ATP-binding protein [Proteobacteria bacterium]|nr:ABC transporter ATP-binding protein [Pseudomonadota bacterium]MBU1716950.1 ABC transporter ATP-binding protein [Pseudomonadota bacterium]
MSKNINNNNRATDFRATGIKKSFSTVHELEVLKGIDLHIKKGEMIAIVGKSGTGKTTLMQILGTLDRPTEGSLFCDGKDVFLKNDSQLSIFRNQTIGFVFQSHHLLPDFTALENTVMPAIIAGMNRKELMAAGHELLARVELTSRLNHKVGELSGGEQQRVALARAMIMKPSLLLADEPTGNLDPGTGNRVFELIQEINQSSGLSTVMVTHNYDLARQMHRCLTLEDGRLCE